MRSVSRPEGDDDGDRELNASGQRVFCVVEWSLGPSGTAGQVVERLRLLIRTRL